MTGDRPVVGAPRMSESGSVVFPLRICGGQSSGPGVGVVRNSGITSFSLRSLIDRSLTVDSDCI